MLLSAITFLLITSLLAYLAVRLLIKPYLLVRFYREQGFPVSFAPLTQSVKQADQNTFKHDDFYHDWVQVAKRHNKRPLAFGRVLGPHVQLIIIDPECMKDYFNFQQHYVKHPRVTAPFSTLAPAGLVYLEGEKWKEHRIMLTSMFQFEKLQAMTPELAGYVVEELEAMKKRIKDMNNVNLYDEFKIIAGNTIGQIFYGIRMSDYNIKGREPTLVLSDIQSYGAEIPYTDAYALGGFDFVKMKFMKDHKKLVTDIEDFRALCSSIVKAEMKKRQEQYDKNGFINQKSDYNMFDFQFLYNLKHPEKQLSEEELLGQFITFFTDGIFTPAHFMTFVLYYLRDQPQWTQTMVSEMDKMFPKMSDLNFEDLQKMDVFTMIQKETHRLAFPDVISAERVAVEDHNLGDIKVKKGTFLTACHLTNLIDDDFFENPLEFDPERWVKEGTTTAKTLKKHPTIYMPFSIGSRQCVGQRFAMMEVRMIIMAFYRMFDYEIADENYKVQWTQRFLREPIDSIPFKITPKKNVQL